MVSAVSPLLHLLNILTLESFHFLVRMAVPRWSGFDTAAASALLEFRALHQPQLHELETPELGMRGNCKVLMLNALQVPDPPTLCIHGETGRGR